MGSRVRWHTRIRGLKCGASGSCWVTVSLFNGCHRMGVDRNERADQQAAEGAKISHEKVVAHKMVTDIWAGLGLQEMPDTYDTDSNDSGGLWLSDAQGDEPVWSPDKRPWL